MLRKLSESCARAALATLIVVALASRAGAFQGHETPAHSGEGEAAHSSEGGHGSGHEETPAILTGDLGNVFWTATIFIILLVVLRTTAWKPILGALQRREEFIAGSLAEAKRDREEAKRLMADYAARIEKARIEASAIIDEGRKDAEGLRRKLHEDTGKEVQEMLARAQRDIKTAQEAAVSEITSKALDLATNMAGKIVRKTLSPADQRSLLDESIAEIGKMN